MMMSEPMNDGVDPSNPLVGLGTMLAAIGREVGGVELDIERHRDRLPSARATQMERLCAEDADPPASDDLPTNKKGGPWTALF